MILVVAYSTEARQRLRNVCRHNESAVVRRFGRAVLFEETELGAFLALRLLERHGADVQVERTVPFNEFETVPEAVRSAAAAYERRPNPSESYAAFSAGSDHPAAEEMAGREL